MTHILVWIRRNSTIWNNISDPRHFFLIIIIKDYQSLAFAVYFCQNIDERIRKRNASVRRPWMITFKMYTPTKGRVGCVLKLPYRADFY